MALVVMATGGTGGHIYPAAATAHELIRRGHAALILGQRGGMEERIAAEQGLLFQGVDAGKLARSGQGRPDPRELIRAGQGVAQARSVLSKLRPGAVVGFGGFASLPGVLAAQSLRIPTVLHEQNARLGLTQRLAVRQAKAVGTAYATVLGLAPRKATLVGMPVREDRMDRMEALGQLKLKTGPLTILVMGGSQGSLFLNNNVPGVLRELVGAGGLLRTGTAHSSAIDLRFNDPEHQDRVDLLNDPASGPLGGEAIQVLHSTGPRWLPEMVQGVRDLDWYHAVGFVDAVAAWSAADLAITRAGTGTLAEAALHGVPTIMVPLPESAENHQLHNAQSVQDAGAGQLVEQPRVGAELGAAVLQCASPAARARMRDAALGRSPVGAAARFADLIEGHLR
ncbi:undecaprenyldiphospho-muramoylpentapeptide beta-N-acetylglucosaminyltransferase [Deinococcus arenicola]|uniref:UDP-N-acetylglucosamine--N-acetylmuramyl-(pentapeptide) pyrophosphoryl-undecaprenol N-acetylglucosamine transferase n=1 Tax=Deinococcus arenicola TaxID=2994950 RepID=A0ABU4DLP9_9DEIO|nr:undecaprenyldiphospho-muramoylpentapeptide beta-N-acetylglucosaminyltransferase [Deinococcus sp. ZS9-10]MDV6373359.1 undecaprenyldiphospho-muramoylpentapeptide beta-N-acetylglucosaminyltransferase [Deinococcus sp. ZS9-10]